MEETGETEETDKALIRIKGRVVCPWEVQVADDMAEGVDPHRRRHRIRPTQTLLLRARILALL